MFIKYDYTADGKPIMVEDTEEVAEFLREDKRLTENAERKERYHCPYSIDALEYEGCEYYYRDTPEQIVRAMREIASFSTYPPASRS